MSAVTPMIWKRSRNEGSYGRQIQYRSDQGHTIWREGPGNYTLVLWATDRVVYSITTLRWAKFLAKNPTEIS